MAALFKLGVFTMLKTMKAKYFGKCKLSGALIKPGDYILYDTSNKTAQLQPDSDTITFIGENGPSTFYRNKRGRCIDAPCCGCCTI
jgi:hypothetical protein